MQGHKVIEVWPWDTIKTILEGLPSLNQQYLLAGLFGSGARLREFTSLKKKDIELTKEGILKILLPTFKNRTIHARTINLFPDTPKKQFESWLIKPIWEYRESRTEPEELLFKKSPRWLESKFKDWFKKHPHFFRHCRSTYNYNFWHMNDVQNQHFMGWSNTQPAAIYTHLRDSDMIEIWNNMKEKEENK